MTFMFQRNLDLNEALLRGFKSHPPNLFINMLDWGGGGGGDVGFLKKKVLGFY